MNIFTVFDTPVVHLVIGVVLLVPIWLYTRTTLVFYPVDRTGRNLTGYRLRYRMTAARTLGMLLAAAYIFAVVFTGLAPSTTSVMTVNIAVPVAAAVIALGVRISEITDRVRDTVAAVWLSVPVGLLLVYTITGLGVFLAQHTDIMTS